jgi:hypothetical protein
MSRMTFPVFLSLEDFSSAYEGLEMGLREWENHLDCDGWIDETFREEFLKISWTEEMWMGGWD